MPTLAVSRSTCSPTRLGAPSATSSFSAISAASVGSDTSVSSTTNSSPPWRLTVSAPRTADSSRRAASCSTWSPLAWPSVSLICLKLLRSRNSSARREPRRLAFAIAWAKRSSSSTRLGNSVSGSNSAERDASLNACVAVSASAWARKTASVSCSFASRSRAASLPPRRCCASARSRRTRLSSARACLICACSPSSSGAPPTASAESGPGAWFTSVGLALLSRHRPRGRRRAVRGRLFSSAGRPASLPDRAACCPRGCRRRRC